jgi:hypothetical protein
VEPEEPKKVYPPPAEMKRNKYGDFVVTKIEIKDDVVEVVEDLEGTSSEEESEEEVKEEEAVEKKGKYFINSNSFCSVVVAKQISKKEQKKLDDEAFNAAMLEVPTEATPKEEKKVE